MVHTKVNLAVTIAVLILTTVNVIIGKPYVDIDSEGVQKALMLFCPQNCSNI